MKPLAITVAATFLSMTASAAVVFQNTTSATGVINALLPAGQVNSIEHGSQVILAGSERMVTSLAVRTRILGAGVATFKAQARLYRNDGPDGRPGTMLWDSGPQLKLVDSGADISIGFIVTSVRVPNSFTYSVQFTERQGNMALLGPSDYNPPTIGAAPFGFWQNPGGGGLAWTYTGIAQPPFGASISADPIPGDLNHDGVVGGLDLGMLLAAWGNCPINTICGCPADLNCDGSINGLDLAVLLAAWG